MKRISICTMLAALLLGGCAKTTESGEYDNEVRYLTAWLKIEHPELEEAHGIKISRDPETGLPRKQDAAFTSFQRLKVQERGLLKKGIT